MSQQLLCPDEGKDSEASSDCISNRCETAIQVRFQKEECYPEDYRKHGLPKPTRKRRFAINNSSILVRLGYKSTERLYQADSALCKQISANFAKSGRSHSWKKPDGERISEKHDLKVLLEQSLAQEHPESSAKLAERLGYANEGYLRIKYSAYCDAIAHKIALQRAKRLEAEAEVLTKALAERPTPNLEVMRKRLGYASSTTLRYNFPDHCAAIDSQIAEESEELLRAKRTSIEKLLDRSFLNWVAIEREIGSRCFIRSHFPKLYERLKDKCNELSSSAKSGSPVKIE